MLSPNSTYEMNGVKVNEKIIPDGSRWKDATKAVKAGFSAGALYKSEKLLCGVGKAASVTIHNTGDLAGVYDDAEQYTRATWPNENMNSARVHYYVDDVGAWQNLKAGTGLCEADPVGKAEVSWHSGDGSIADGGNMTSISIEIIMGESTETDKKAYDNGARIAAWLLWKNELTIDKLVTHTYWVNKLNGKVFADVDSQCTNPISGQKWCPTYIFASNTPSVARNNWLAFKQLVNSYLQQLKCQSEEPKVETPETPEESNNNQLPFAFKVKKEGLMIHTDPSEYDKITRVIEPGVFTIVELRGSWGRLKSGAGWIWLGDTSYSQKLQSTV